MKKIVCLFLLSTLCLLTSACTANFANYGRFAMNAETEVAFNRYEVNPAFHYYISGPDFFPNALLGLHKDYRLSPATLWKEVKMTPTAMKETVEQMKTQAFRFRHFPDSYQLIDHQGRPVGVWYSIREATTYLRTEADGTLMIDTPPIDVFIKLEYPLSF